MIRVAKTAGFCFGVNRAVETVYKLLDEDKTVCTLGPIIHNPQLVEELGRKGVRIIDAPEDAKAGETVVIRSHGVPPEVIEKLKALGVDYKDATCPYVQKIHRFVSDGEREGTGRRKARATGKQARVHHADGHALGDVVDGHGQEHERLALEV